MTSRPSKVIIIFHFCTPSSPSSSNTAEWTVGSSPSQTPWEVEGNVDHRQINSLWGEAIDRLGVSQKGFIMVRFFICVRAPVSRCPCECLVSLPHHLQRLHCVRPELPPWKIKMETGSMSAVPHTTLLWSATVSTWALRTTLTCVLVAVRRAHRRCADDCSVALVELHYHQWC